MKLPGFRPARPHPTSAPPTRTHQHLPRRIWKAAKAGYLSAFRSPPSSVARAEPDRDRQQTALAKAAPARRWASQHAQIIVGLGRCRPRQRARQSRSCATPSPAGLWLRHLRAGQRLDALRLDDARDATAEGGYSGHRLLCPRVDAPAHLRARRGEGGPQVRIRRRPPRRRRLSIRATGTRWACAPQSMTTLLEVPCPRSASLTITDQV